MSKEFGTICAVIVAYNPDEGFADRVKATAQQVDKVIIVDNGSEKSKVRDLKDLPPSVSTIANSKNRGLATAQNQGIKHALKEGFNWVLLLDDDSEPQPHMIRTMKEVYLVNAVTCDTEVDWEKTNMANMEEGQRNVSILAPQLQDVGSGNVQPYIVPFLGLFFRRKYCLPEHGYLAGVLAVIASGSLIKAELFREIGLMREGFFIDYVDTEFCLRAKTRGHNIMVVCNALLSHRLGNKVNHSLGPMQVTTSNHSPERRYTIFRNRTKVWREYWTRIPSYIIYDFMAALYDLCRIAAFEKQSKAKLKAAWRGFREGCKS